MRNNFLLAVLFPRTWSVFLKSLWKTYKSSWHARPLVKILHFFVPSAQDGRYYYEIKRYWCITHRFTPTLWQLSNQENKYSYSYYHRYKFRERMAIPYNWPGFLTSCQTHLRGTWKEFDQQPLFTQNSHHFRICEGSILYSKVCPSEWWMIHSLRKT